MPPPGVTELQVTYKALRLLGFKLLEGITLTLTRMSYTHTPSRPSNTCRVKTFHGVLQGPCLKNLSGTTIRWCDTCPNHLAFHASLETIQIKWAYGAGGEMYSFNSLKDILQEWLPKGPFGIWKLDQVQSPRKAALSRHLPQPYPGI